MTTREHTIPNADGSPLMRGAARGPRTARGARTRARLIEAAREELVQRAGVLEVDSVARRAGLSVGAIYRHFDSRAGLIAAVVNDFYSRYRSEALEINPAPGASYAVRERKRTELSVAFHYNDPLAPIILSSLHLDAEIAIRETTQIAEMINLATEVMKLGQKRGEIPVERDARFIGAMVIGGMRHVLSVALGSEPPIPQQTTTTQLWALTAAIMGVEP